MHKVKNMIIIILQTKENIQGKKREEINQYLHYLQTVGGGGLFTQRAS